MSRGRELLMKRVKAEWRRRFSKVLAVHPDIEERVVKIAEKLQPVNLKPSDYLDQLTKVALMDKMIEEVVENGGDAHVVIKKAKRFIAKNWRKST